MSHSSIGIILALVTLIIWGLNEFITQRAARAYGIWASLFWNGLLGTLVLTPFVIKDLLYILDQADFMSFVTLAVAGGVTLITILLNIETLREGKLSVVEPLFAIELPMTVALGAMFIHERLDSRQAILIGFVFAGILLTIAKRVQHLRKKLKFEKGITLAIISVLVGSTINYFIGVSSQLNSPLLTTWFIELMVFMTALAYIPIMQLSSKKVFEAMKKQPILILTEAFLDNAGWLSFAVATTIIPISIATTISGSYLALAILLGIYINKEKIVTTQKLGITVTIIGVMALSAISWQ